MCCVHSHFPVAHHPNSNRWRAKYKKKNYMYNFHLKYKLPLLVLLQLFCCRFLLSYAVCIYYMEIGITATFFSLHHISNLICLFNSRSLCISVAKNSNSNSNISFYLLFCFFSYPPTPNTIIFCYVLFLCFYCEVYKSRNQQTIQITV